ncbi:flavoprotein [Plantactinospora mayteni]|uniref:Flavoprotein n=1 Tax=Plantactinospora mayteni TaxID=566021 RepID=A0ABQ4EP20_9ACTN|nr:flavoprotein [Plantactinospora mayteni]GIG96390.1 flavoprotein [Plantactinospora mayteni]
MSARPVLYLVVCAAPPALKIDELIALLMDDGWAVWVIATPTAATWIDRETLAQQTGNPVRSERRKPAEPDLLPKADVVLVIPATFNTINKWALGINDTLALGVLNEMLGLGLPILVSPYAKNALVTHPAYQTHVQTLSASGVTFTAADLIRPADPGAPFQWPRLAGELARLPPSAQRLD